eukprot:403364564
MQIYQSQKSLQRQGTNNPLYTKQVSSSLQRLNTRTNKQPIANKYSSSNIGRVGQGANNYRLLFNSKQDANQSKILNKLRHLEEEIQQRQGFSDLLYRQQQLEEAVIEASRVNKMIEDERQKMKQKQHDLLNQTISSQKVVTLSNTLMNQGNRQNTNTLRNSNRDQSIRDIQKQKSNVGLKKQNTNNILRQSHESADLRMNTSSVSGGHGSNNSNRFEDNYEFYIHHLNKQGHLATQQEQLQEQIKIESNRVIKINPKTKKPITPGQDQEKAGGLSKLGTALRQKLGVAKQQTLKKQITKIQTRLTPSKYGIKKLDNQHSRNISNSTIKSSNLLSVSNASHSNRNNNHNNGQIDHQISKKSTQVKRNNIPSMKENSNISSKYDNYSKLQSYKFDSEGPTPERILINGKEQHFFGKNTPGNFNSQQKQQSNKIVQKQQSRVGLPPINNLKGSQKLLEIKKSQETLQNQKTLESKNYNTFDHHEQIQQFSDMPQTSNKDRKQLQIPPRSTKAQQQSRIKLLQNGGKKLVNQTLDEKQEPNLKLPYIFNKLTNTIQKYEKNQNPNQTLPLNIRKQKYGKSEKLLKLYDNNMTLSMTKENKSLSPEQRDQHQKENRWNIHLNDTGIKNKLLLLKKAKQYYIHEVKHGHVPKTDQNKQVEIMIRKSAIDHKKGVEQHKPIKRINLEDLIERIKM